MARLILQSKEFDPATKDLNWGVTRIGRAADNDFVISHPSVSGHHCEIELGMDIVRVRDCQSTNGTFIDNQRIQSGEIQPGQVLRLGDVAAVVERANDIVSVPKFEVRKAPQSVELGEGIWSCERHGAVRARWRCPKCNGRYCSGCIHELRLMRGRPHRLCPVCSAHVEWIQYADDPTTKKSVWSHVRNFLRGGD